MRAFTAFRSPARIARLSSSGSAATGACQEQCYQDQDQLVHDHRASGNRC